MDHSFEPIRGIAQMLEVAKPGSVVDLRHALNEAERAKYHGLHQWNFDLQEGRFVIWNPSHRIDVAEVFAPYATVEAKDLGYLTVILKKQSSIASSEWLDPRARVRELLDLLAADPHDAQEIESRAVAAESKLAAAEAKLGAVDSRLNATLRSSSWRVTSPLRAIARMVKSLR